jgi:drug/metabolite transporter (DMT)-like permease
MTTTREWDTRPVRPWLAASWMTAASALFAVMNLFAKRASREVPWHEVAFGRAVFGALTIYAAARRSGVSLEVHDPPALRRRTAAGTIAMAASFLALSRLPLGDAVTLGNLTPLLVAIFARRALGEATSSTLGVSIVLGFVGVATLAGPKLHGLDHQAVGLAASLTAAGFSAVAMIQLRKLGRHETPESVALHFVGWSSTVMLAIGAIGTASGASPWHAPSLGVAALIVGAGITGGGAQLTMTTAYGFDKAARVGAIGYVSVVLSQVLGYLFLDERPSTLQLLGAAIVLVSGLTLVAGGVREARASVPPEGRAVAGDGEAP